MAILLCKICGYETFEAYGLKRDGKLICPQCSTFYHTTEKNTKTTSPAKFKFKIQPQEQSPETA